MFEKFYTTKMSLDKKKLEGRFSKISFGSKKSTKIIGFSVFVLLVALIAAVSVYISTTTKEYLMSQDELAEYTKRPVGAVMAEIDYADDEKVVFHYLDGLFVYDIEKAEISKAFDLKTMNISYNMQGDAVLCVVVTDDGKTAYLCTKGPVDVIEAFDTYRLDLESGKAYKEKIAEGAVEFAGFSDVATQNIKIDGWHSDRVVINNGKIYALTIRDNLIGSLELVTFAAGQTDVKYSYVFDTDYRNTDELKLEKIRLVIKNSSEILWEERNSFETEGQKLSSISQCFDGNLKEQINRISDGNYDLIFVPVIGEYKTEMYLFVFNNYSFDIVAYGVVSNQQFGAATEALLATPEETEDGEKSELYLLTESYLKEEFEKVFSPYYDITRLVIFSWDESENGNEAIFGYSMYHQNYNRDPDTVDYIKKAKQESSPERYQKLYDDYLAEKCGNFQFKVVRDGDELLLYSNDSPTGVSWSPVKISDFLLG